MGFYSRINIHESLQSIRDTQLAIAPSLISPSARPTVPPPENCTPLTECYPTKKHDTSDTCDFVGTLFQAMVPSVSNESFLYVLGGRNQNRIVSLVERYDPTRNLWKKLDYMQPPRASFSAVELKGKIFIIGGTNDTGDTRSSCVQSVQTYDPGAVCWKSATPMNTRRRGLGSCVLGEQIYSIGGEDINKALKVVERYDQEVDRWELLKPLNTPRTNITVATMQGMVYAIGGHDGESPLKTVERYDPKTNTWLTVNPMNTRRRGATSVVISDKLYVMGGHAPNSTVSSVELYEPRTNKWFSVASMLSRRTFFGATALGNIIFVSGGASVMHPTAVALNSAEQYNIVEDRWEAIEAMSEARCFCQLVATN